MAVDPSRPDGLEATHLANKQEGNAFALGLPHPPLSHRGSSPLPGFKASQPLRSWDNMCPLRGLPAPIPRGHMLAGGRVRGCQAAPEPWREMKSTPDSREAAGGRLAPRSPAGPTIISYDKVYIMLLVSFLVITFY